MREMLGNCYNPDHITNCTGRYESCEPDFKVAKKKLTKPNPTPHKEDDLDVIFSTLNGSGAHACYCERSTDGGCKCALKDEYIVEAKKDIEALIQTAVTKELASTVLAGMPELTPRQQEYVTKRLAQLNNGDKHD